MIDFSKTNAVETLAEQAHKSWSGWTKYIFSKTELMPDGTRVIPTWAVERWERQFSTDYKDLPESEKPSDRKEAAEILEVLKGIDTNSISDGYHTFGELYEHRISLFIALCRLLATTEPIIPNLVWRSRLHSDGSSFEGWFILGLGDAHGKQISYHLPVVKWDLCNFADSLEKAPEWDGHTSEDVLKRLQNL